MSYYYDDENRDFREEADRPPQQPRRRKPPKKQDDNDVGSWILIAVLFGVGAWPVALILLIAKLSGGKKKRPAARTGGQSTSARKSAAQTEPAWETASRRGQEPEERRRDAGTSAGTAKSSKTMRIIGIILTAISVIGLLNNIVDLSALDYSPQLLMRGILYPLGMLASGIGLLLGSRAINRRTRRFGKYLACAQGQEAVSLRQLAETAEVSQRRVEKDLELMIEQGLWGSGAYVDLGCDMLFRSPEAEQAYHARNAMAQESPAQAEEGYSGVLREIHRANDRIADSILSEQIDRLEEVAGKILRIIEKEPAKKDKAGTFLNYYLPTTLKLLDSYAEFEEAGVSGANLNQAKEKIEGTMASIVAGFERQLDELYRTEAMDINSDIRVMETMLRRDSASVADDFGLEGGSAVQQKEE